jgi:hypothetical protein
MKIRTMILSAMVALSWLALGVGAKADLTLDTPSGLNPGEQFRFVFVTDGTTNANSGLIGDYNMFVNNDATAEAGGGSNVVKYMGVTLTWSAIASTPGTSAITNIGENTTQAISIYLASGVEITTADNSSGLWSGSLLAPIHQDLLGHSISAQVWTGTGADGSGAFGGGNVLGGQFAPVWGSSSASSSNWVNDGIASGSLDFPLYGISQVLTAQGTAIVPEPSTAIVAAFGAVAFAAYGWSRHRREERRQAAA